MADWQCWLRLSGLVDSYNYSIEACQKFCWIYFCIVLSVILMDLLFYSAMLWTSVFVFVLRLFDKCCTLPPPFDYLWYGFLGIWNCYICIWFSLLQLTVKIYVSSHQFFPTKWVGSKVSPSQILVPKVSLPSWMICGSIFIVKSVGEFFALAH